MEYKIRVENIVASGSLGMQVPLQKIVSKIEGSEYEPEQFPGLVYKLVEPNATFLLFSNGKLVCTGTKNNQQLNDSMEQLIKRIKEANTNK